MHAESQFVTAATAKGSTASLQDFLDCIETFCDASLESCHEFDKSTWFLEEMVAQSRTTYSRLCVHQFPPRFPSYSSTAMAMLRLCAVASWENSFEIGRSRYVTVDDAPPVKCSRVA